MVRKSDTATTAQTFDLASVSFEDADDLPGQLRSGRTAQDNPFVPKLSAVEWDSPKVFTVPNGDQVRSATNGMRQAAARLSVGMKLRYNDGNVSLSYEDACKSTTPVRIVFVKTQLREKQERRYSASDIRDWLRSLVDAGELDMHHDECGNTVKAFIEGAQLTPEIRAAYREAHGLAK